MREKRVKVDRVAKPLHRYFRYLGSAFISNTDHNSGVTWMVPDMR